MPLPAHRSALVLALLLAAQACDRRVRVASAFGEYESPALESYGEWVRTAEYVEMRDGVRLAVDLVRPAADGVPVPDPLPTVWTHHRYHRARLSDGKVYSIVDLFPPARALVQHGYVVVAVDVRGSGASFGRYTGAFSREETRDAYEITQWIARQPWSDGNVGMFGQSYLGITQFMAAGQAPPALKAIFPSMAGFDLYDLAFPGGVYRKDFIDTWGRLTRQLDTEVPVPPVDGEDAEKLREQALAEHRDNWDPITQVAKGRFRDAVVDGRHLWTEGNPAGHLEAINASGIPVYQWNGWYDIYTRDVFLWFANLKTPNKLVLGPWSHGAADSLIRAEGAALITTEQLRWFDHWLKGIANGVMNEDAINYATMIEPGRWTWRSTAVWPLADLEMRQYYFSAGPSGSADSRNDGRLARERPAEAQAHDTYQIDPTTTTGTATRWDNGVGTAMAYPDLRLNDAKGLTYTTPVLMEDVTVTGHPVVTVFVTSTADDADVYVYLQEVTPDGASHYISEGILRASHRATAAAPYDILGLPYHRSFAADAAPLPAGEPTPLEFDLIPTSNVFNAGNRIRVTITGADVDNTERPSHLPTIRLYRDREHASSIQLPVTP